MLYLGSACIGSIEGKNAKKQAGNGGGIVLYLVLAYKTSI